MIQRLPSFLPMISVIGCVDGTTSCSSRCGGRQFCCANYFSKAATLAVSVVIIFCCCCCCCRCWCCCGCSKGGVGSARLGVATISTAAGWLLLPFALKGVAGRRCRFGGATRSKMVLRHNLKANNIEDKFYLVLRVLRVCSCFLLAAHVRALLALVRLLPQLEVLFVSLVDRDAFLLVRFHSCFHNTYCKWLQKIDTF